MLGTIWATTLITQQAWLWSLPWIARGCSPPRCSSSSCCSLALCRSSTPIAGPGRVLLAGSALIGLDVLACATVLDHATITGLVVPLALAGSGLRIIAVGLVAARQLQA